MKEMWIAIGGFLFFCLALWWAVSILWRISERSSPQEEEGIDEKG